MNIFNPSCAKVSWKANEKLINVWEGCDIAGGGVFGGGFGNVFILLPDF